MPTLAPQPPRKEKGAAGGRPGGRPEGRARGGKPNGKPNGKASGSHGHASGSLAPAPRTSPQKGTTRPTNGSRPAPGLPTPGGKAGGASALKTPSPEGAAGSPAEETPLAELPVIWLTGRNAIPYPFHFRKDARTLHPVTDPGVLAALSAKKDARGLSLSKAVSIAVAHAFNGAEYCAKTPTALLSPVRGGRLALGWLQGQLLLKGYLPTEARDPGGRWTAAEVLESRRPVPDEEWDDAITVPFRVLPGGYAAQLDASKRLSAAIRARDPALEHYETRTFRPSDLVALQDVVSRSTASKYAAAPSPDAPIVVREHGTFYLLNGHHRAVGDWAANRPIRAKLFNLDLPFTKAVPRAAPLLKGHWFSPAELKTMQLKWVTAHPNGPGTEGKPILVHDNGDSYTVVGGAGGSMNQMVLDKSKTKAPDEQKALRQAGAEKRKAAAQALKEKDPAAFEKIVQAKKLYTAKVKSATAAYRAEALKTMGVNIDAVVTKARTEAATQAMKADPKATPEEVKAHADKAEASVVSQAHAAVDSALRGALDAVARARINQEAPTSQDVKALVAGTEIVKKLSPSDLKALMTKATSLDQIKTVQRALQKAMRTGKAEHALGLDLNILDKAPTDAEVNQLVTDGYLGRRGVKLQTALVKESHRASPEAAVHHEALGAMDGLNAYTQATGADAVITPELATKLDARGLARVAAAHLLDKHADAKALAVDLEKKLADRSDLHAAAALNLCAQLHHLGVGAVHAAQGADGSVTMVSAHQAQMDNAAKAAQVANLARGQIRAASELHNLLVAPDPSPLELLSAASPIAAKAQARAMGLDTGDFTVEASGDGHKVMVKAAAIGKLAHPAAATDPDRARRMAELKQEVAHPEHGAWRSPNLAPGVTLAPHQQLWAQAIIKEKRVAGNQGAGSGKTAVYYAALDHLLSTGAISKALMTMPAKPRSQQEDYRARAAAGDVGAKEQAKAKGTPEEWRPDPTDASFLVSDKTGEKRKFLTGKGAEAFHVVENTAALADHLKAAKAGEKRVLIMSPEMMRAHEAELEAAGFGKPDSAYFPDEAHELTQTPAEVAAAERGKITSHKAQAAERIAKGSGYFAPGSGTFLSTGPADVYGILHLTDPTAFPRDGAAAFSAEWSRAAEAGQDAMFGPEATSRLAQRVNPYMVSYHAPVTAKDPATGATHELHQAHKVERVPLTADQTTAMAAVNKKYEQDRVSPDPKVRAGASFVRYAGLSKAMAGAPMYAAMQQMLTDSVAKDPSFKPVIWSQGLESLDELEKRLTKAGHKVVRVDGSTGTAAVQAAMHAFNEGDARVLLVSNAGNFGLNAQGGREIWKVGSPDTAAKDTQLDHRVDRNGQTQDTVSRTFIGKHQLAEAALQHLAVRSRQLALLGEIGKAGRQAAATDDSGRAAAIAAHLPAIAAAAGVSAGQQQAQAIAKALAKAFDPTEPRDPGGKWTQEVYHGTGRAFGTFAEAPPASVTGNPTAGWGHFFTPTRGEAARYVKDFSGGKGRVIAARLNLQNPYVMSYGEHKRFTDPDEWTDAGMAKKRVEADAFKQELLAEGYDGIIIGRGAYQEFVAFHPHQISVTGEDVMKAYSPSEARDPAGRWTDSGAPAMGPHLPPLAHEPSMHDLAAGTAHGYEAVADASRHLLKERIERTPHLHLTWGEVAHGAKHLAGEIKEKVDIRETFKALKALGKQHGPAFLAYAIAIEAFEDVVVPAILTSIGKPYLIPVALAVHTEPIMYPLYFAVSKYMKQRKARRLAGIPLTREQIGKALWAAMAPRQALAFGRAP